jgi:regulator of replication initiation timing
MKTKLIILAIVCSPALFAQNITNTLSAGGLFYVKDAVNNFLTVNPANGHTGLGLNVTNPRASLEVGGTDGLLVTGTANSGTIMALGAGVRLHWYPRKGAFRVGYAETTWWDDNGSANPNLALYSIGMGYQARASAVATTSIGAYNKATGDYSLSLGSYSTASASHAVAIGTQAIASGIYSIALGSGANTNGRDGSMVIGDDSYFQTAYSSADNQLTMRFSGGYRLWSSYPDSVAGVYMRHGQSGWSNYCDRNIKENFTELDGEELLEKLHNIPVTEWNYKRGDTSLKYVGPMAQDFYAAFHLGGTDSLGINSISIDGVNMAGIKALEQRTREMKTVLTTVKEMKTVLTTIQEQNVALMEENKRLKEQLTGLKEVSEQVASLKLLKAEMLEQLKMIKTKNGIEVSAQ